MRRDVLLGEDGWIIKGWDENFNKYEKSVSREELRENRLLSMDEDELIEYCRRVDEVDITNLEEDVRKWFKLLPRAEDQKSFLIEMGFEEDEIRNKKLREEKVTLLFELENYRKLWDEIYNFIEGVYR